MKPRKKVFSSNFRGGVANLSVDYSCIYRLANTTDGYVGLKKVDMTIQTEIFQFLCYYFAGFLMAKNRSILTNAGLLQNFYLSVYKTYCCSSYIFLQITHSDADDRASRRQRLKTEK